MRPIWPLGGVGLACGGRRVEDGDRLFPIQNHGYDFFTGTCSDGRQVVMGLLCPHLVAYFFDADGRLLSRERRPWDHPAPTMGADGPYRIYDDEFKAAFDRQMAAFKAEIGYRVGTIRVRMFADPEETVGIELFEDEFYERDMPEGQRCSFVWLWAEDYWMSADGEVEST